MKKMAELGKDVPAMVFVRFGMPQPEDLQKNRRFVLIVKTAKEKLRFRQEKFLNFRNFRKKSKN